MLAIRFGNAAAAHAYLRDADLQNLVSGITTVPDALSVAGHRIAVHLRSAGFGTFRAERRRTEPHPFTNRSDRRADHTLTLDVRDCLGARSALISSLNGCLSTCLNEEDERIHGLLLGGGGPRRSLAK